MITTTPKKSRPLAIRATNADALQKALDAVQGKSTQRILTPQDLLEYAAIAESKLKHLGLPLDVRAGSSFEVGPERMPNAYWFRADSTICRLRRNSVGWTLEMLKREGFGCVSGGRDRRTKLKLSQQAADYLLNNEPLADRFRALIADAVNRGRQAALNEVRTSAPSGPSDQSSKDAPPLPKA